MSGMTRYALILLALGLLLPACRHKRGTTSPPHYSHEEAEPVSNLPQHEFHRITPRR